MTNQLEQLAVQFKALADPIRMRLIALCGQGECSVSELTEVIGLSQPRISQHLKQLCAPGILRRFRDGKWVFYRVAGRRSDGLARRGLLDLIPLHDPVFEKDLSRLQELRGESAGLPGAGDAAERQGDRVLFKALVELTVTAQLGDLLDIGCGRGQILKLLATRANRAVGVDIDADTTRLARAELLLAGLPNCSLRSGDMYRLPFGDADFDTIILDDIIADAKHPVRALTEARRVLKPKGRLIVLLAVGDRSAVELQRQLAGWSRTAGLRLAPARLAPKINPQWLLSVATAPDSQSAAT
jgi:ArsR family transcriptional regulator